MYVRCWDIPPGPAGLWAPPVPPPLPLLPPLLLAAEPDWRSENTTNDKVLREGLREKTDEPREMFPLGLHSFPFLLSSFFCNIQVRDKSENFLTLKTEIYLRLTE